MTDNIKAEPVAWMYEGPHGADLCLAQWADGKWYAPRNWRDWTETPLYTADQLEAARTQGWNEAIDAAADWFADRFSDAVQADCESGVKWLNERAAKAYLKDAPDTLAAIREGEEAIRALTKDSTHD